MTTLILHHYPASPFAEKIRAILGYKQLAWSSVMIPVIMPKPDVIALTGGYRRTPILQIGSDIYCDTALIADVLEELAPTPSLYPAESAGTARFLARWADSTLFWTAIPYSMQPEGLKGLFAGLSEEATKAFSADRAAMRSGAPSMRIPDAVAAISIYFKDLESMLADGRPWLCGNQPSIADFSVYHSLWYISRAGTLAEVLKGVAGLMPWMARVREFGHGSSNRLTSAEAIEVARAQPPIDAEKPLVGVPGLEYGAEVVVTPTDYALDSVAGKLVGATATSVSLLRVDPRAGPVTVHFPRIGYKLRLPKA